MSELSKYLVEQILLEDTTDKIKKTVVVYAGRFQPFHIGHYKTYQNLVKEFGKSNVYIGTSNVVDNKKSPFNFKEKVQIITSMFDVPKANIVQVKQPYKPVEILSKFDDASTAFVTVVGEKDANRLGGTYFRKYNGKIDEPYRDAGYVFVSPKQPNEVSGTAVRNGLSNGTDDEKKMFFTKRAYPKFNPTIFSLITNKLQESYEIQKETIEDWLINESTINAFDQADDGPSSFFPNLEVFSKISHKRAKKIGYEVLNMIMTADVEDYYEHPEYPNGPVKAVSYYPAGVIGKMTPNNQIDIYSSGAYTDWYTQVTRKAALVGYQVIQSQLEKDNNKEIQLLSTIMAKADKELEKEFELFVNESITLPIEIGDTLLMGKWKNKPVIVKTIDKDEHGMPIINGKKVVTFRYGKKGPNVFENYIEFASVNENEDDKYTHIGYGRFKKKGHEKDSTSPTFTKDDNGKYITTSTKKQGAKPKPISKPKVNIFDKPAPIKKTIDKFKDVKSKIQSWSEEEKQFFMDEMKKGESQIRRSIGETIKDKLKGAWIRIKKGAQHEVKEFKEAGVAAKNLVSGNKLSDSEKKALKSVAIKVITTAAFGAVTGGASHGVSAFAKHVALEFIPHVVGETLLKGVGAATLFAGMEDDDQALKTFIESAVKRFNTDSIPNDVMQRIINNYNKEMGYLNEDILTGFKNLGISRSDMPQIESKDLKKYINYIKSNGYTVKEKNYPIKKLNLTQRDINTDKVEKLMTVSVSNLNKPIIISSGGYILDGHHRVLALYALDSNATIPVVQVNLEIGKLLKISRNWDNSTFKNIHESILLTEATNKLKLTIPANVKKIVKAFKKYNKKVYIVGGAVRDAILGKTPHDFDLTTDAKPHEMVDICNKEGLKYDDTSIIYGMLIIGGDEVVTFRKDIGTSRKLDGIDYTDIAGDVKRRDLTINALFYDIDRGEIVDLVGGIADLKKKLIRTVGNAADRFEEDHLRKLRAVRFTVKMGGMMETETLLAIKKDPTLKDVSTERIRMEFMKSVESAKSTKIYLDLMEKLQFLKLTFPNLKITKPYVDSSDYIVLMAYLLQKNSADTLESELNKINYTISDIRNVKFLQSLIKFDPKNIVELKKAQKISSVTDSQIKEFGKLIKQDFKKFLKFNLSVKGNDAPSDIKGKEIGTWISKEETKRYLNESVVEMAKPELNTVEKFADKKLDPIDVEFTNHFFDRLNNERNGKEITPAELIGFFKRLAKHKRELKDFLSKYHEIMVKDGKTKINIPFVKQANKIIAKTVMRTANWTQKKTPEFKFESIIPTTKEYRDGLLDLKKAIVNGTNGFNNSEVAKLYYQNAMKFGINKNLITNKDRLAINRYNKKNFTIGGPSTKNAVIGGIDLVLNLLNDNLNEESLKELAWESKTVDLCMAQQIPMTPKLMNKVFGKSKATVMHITNPAGLDALLKIQGTQKSLSSFTKASNGSQIVIGGGIKTSGGVIVAIEGDIIISANHDIMSRPDKQGRRWVDNYYLLGDRGTPKIIETNKKLKAFADKYGEVDDRYGDIRHYDRSSVTNAEINEFIRLYISEAEKYVLNHSEDILVQHVGDLNKKAFGWNEVLVNNIKVVDVLALDWKLRDSELNDIIKKFNNAMVVSSPKAIPTFIRKHGEFITERINTQSTSIIENIDTPINEAPAGSATDILYLMRNDYFPIFPTIMEKIIGKTTVLGIHITDVWNYKNVKKLEGTKKTISTFTNLTSDSPMMQLQGLRTSGGVFVAIKGTLLLRSIHDVWSNIDVQGRKWVPFDEFFPKGSSFAKYLNKMLMANPIYNKHYNNLREENPISNSDLGQLTKAYIDVMYKFMLMNKQYIRDKFTGNLNDLEGKWNELLIGDIRIVDTLVVLNNKDTDITKFKQNIYPNVKITYEVNDLRKFINKYGGAITENINEAVKSRPTATFLIGPPAAGKSTWVSKHGSGKIIISRDDIAEKVAKANKISYNDLFDGTHEDLQKKISSELQNHINSSIKSGKDIIVDMTNVSKKSRNSILSRLPKTYIKNAVVFNVSRSELLKRLTQREKETGKHISSEVLDDMMARYEKPTKDEFDNITNEAVTQKSKIMNEVDEIPLNPNIKNFKDLFKRLPSELQKRIYELRHIAQNEKWHPEGNVLKHTIVVVNQALKHAPGDVDLALAAIFHDIGKDETASINPRTGKPSHFGHERVSANLVNKYSSTIKSIGGNPDDIYWIVSQHMRMHQFDVMKLSKQRALQDHPKFDKLQKFATKMDIKGYHENINNLVNDIDSQLESFVLPNVILNEGGAYGHMNHPFDTDINLTFGQLKDIVIKALDGKLEVTKEKTDGQALSVSWKNGKLIAARNKGHLKNQGENALDISAVADKFKNRGGLTDAYNYAMADLSKSIGALSEKQREKIFQHGSSFMNLEVIWPDSVNVIPYGQALLVFHSTMQYDMDGNAIGQNVDAAKMLAGMIKQVNQHVQSKYVIQGPPMIELPKNQNLSSKKPAYLAKISKLQKEFGLKDTDGVAEYHQAWWNNYVTKNSPTTLDKNTHIQLVKRWAFFDKSFRLDTSTLTDEKVLAWAKKVDSEDQKIISKDNLMKFEDIFLGIGADVLEFTQSVLTVNPDEAVRKMKDRIKQTIVDVRKSNDPKKIEKLKLELKRLNAIGGMDKIVPSEGIVFTYPSGPNGHIMKLTGSFAAANQILGIFFDK